MDKLLFPSAPFYAFFGVVDLLLVLLSLYMCAAHFYCSVCMSTLIPSISLYVNTVMLSPDILFDNYLALSSSLPDNVSLWPITLFNVFFTVLISEVVYIMVSETLIMPQLQLLTSKEAQLNTLQFFS